MVNRTDISLTTTHCSEMRSSASHQSTTLANNSSSCRAVVYLQSLFNLHCRVWLLLSQGEAMESEGVIHPSILTLAEFPARRTSFEVIAAKTAHDRKIVRKLKLEVRGACWELAASTCCFNLLLLLHHLILQAELGRCCLRYGSY